MERAPLSCSFRWEAGGPPISLAGLLWDWETGQRSWSVRFNMHASHQRAAGERVGLTGPAMWTEHLLFAGVPGMAEAWSLLSGG